MTEENSATDVNPMDALDFSTEDEAPETVETQETTTEDSSTEENKEETTTPEKETEGESEDVSDDESEDTSETEEDGESKPKNSAQNRIRSLANENRALKQEVERLNAQFYQPQSAEELQESGMDETQAQIEVLRQERLMDQANSHITALNTDLNMEAIQLAHDYPIFDPDSKEYDEKFAEKVRGKWIEASGLTQDPNTGLFTQARVLPYDFYKSYAEAREEGKKQGAIVGRRDYEKTANAADVAPVASPKDEKKDPLMEVLLAD